MKKYLKSIVLLVFVLFSYQNISSASEINNFFSEEFKQYEKINKEQIFNLLKIVNEKASKVIAEKDKKIKELNDINDDCFENYSKLLENFNNMQKECERLKDIEDAYYMEKAIRENLEKERDEAIYGRINAVLGNNN